jgi:hypothetical protein
VYRCVFREVIARSVQVREGSTTSQSRAKALLGGRSVCGDNFATACYGFQQLGSLIDEMGNRVLRAWRNLAVAMLTAVLLGAVVAAAHPRDGYRRLLTQPLVASPGSESTSRGTCGSAGIR